MACEDHIKTGLTFICECLKVAVVHRDALDAVQGFGGSKSAAVNCTLVVGVVAAKGGSAALCQKIPRTLTQAVANATNPASMVGVRLEKEV